MKKSKILTTICGATMATILSFSASAQENLPPKTKILADFESKGGITSYMGSSYGLDGWLLIDQNKNAQYAYTNKEGATLLGVLFDPQGEPETVKQLKQLKNQKTGSQDAIEETGAKTDNPAEIIYNQFANSGWIHIGDKDAPYFYAIVTIDSAESAAMLNKMQKYIDSKKVSIRLVPISTSEQSFYDTARIMSSDNPAEAIVKYIRKEKVIIPSREEINTELYAKLDTNANLAKNISLKGVPLIVYRRPIDSKISVILGVPDNAMLLASEIQNPVKGTLTTKPAEIKKTKTEEAK